MYNDVANRKVDNATFLSIIYKIIRALILIKILTNQENLKASIWMHAVLTLITFDVNYIRDCYAQKTSVYPSRSVSSCCTYHSPSPCYPSDQQYDLQIHSSRYQPNPRINQHYDHNHTSGPPKLQCRSYLRNTI